MADFGLSVDKTDTNFTKMSHVKHSHEMLLHLNELRHCSNLCDGEIVLSDGRVDVQCNVLAAGSPYFRALFKFESNLSECEKERKRSYKLDDMSCHVFNSILDFIYTSDLELCDENIQEMLQAADLLLLEDVKTMCCDYLEQCITVNNCVGILQFTERFSCPRVHHLAQTFIDDHFIEVCFSEEFLQLDEERVCALMNRTSLMINTEDFMYETLRRWIDHKPETREQSFPQLLYSCVNLALLDERFLVERVLGDVLVQKHGLRDWILSKRLSPLPQGQQILPSQPHPQQLQQLSQQQQGFPQQLTQQRGFCTVLVVSGGEGPADNHSGSVEIKKLARGLVITGRETDEMETRGGGRMGLTGTMGRWLDLAPMMTERTGHGLVSAGGFLFAVGGRDNTGRLLTSAEKYNPHTNTWTPIAPMNHARVAFGLVAIDDRLYAIGGSNDMSDPLTSMESYDIHASNSTWTQLPDMNLKRAWSAFAVCQKKIYVIGGGVMGKLYEAVESYDPRTQTWSAVAPLKERRFDAKAVGVGGQIYVFGGLRRLECPSVMHPGGGSGMKFCGTEIWDSEQRTWTMQSRDQGMCSMRESSRLDAVLECGEEIVLVGAMEMGGGSGPGGVAGQHFHCVRSWHPSLKLWRCVAQNHPPCQRGVAAALLRMPRARLHNIAASTDSTGSFD